MNTDDWNAAKGGRFFLHILSMILSHGRLNMDHSRKSYLKISLRKRFYSNIKLYLIISLN